MTVFLNHWPLWSNFAPAGAAEMFVQRTLGNVYHLFVQLCWPTGGQHPALIAFFVLSGFCVHLPFERRLGEGGVRVNWSGYFARRIRRIMPVYWVGALLGLLFVAAERVRPTGDGLLALHAALTPWQAAARMGGWSSLWLEEIFGGNYILHTVSAEILIYALYPVFHLAAARGQWRLLALVAAGLQVLVLPLSRLVDPYVLFPGVLMMGLFWYLGALAARWHCTREWRPRGRELGALWGLFLALQMTPHFYGLNMIKQLVCGLICMAGIVWLVGWERRHEAQRDRPWARVLRWFGRISYPLYAVHTPVIFLVNWTMLTVFASRSYGWQLAFNLAVPLLAAVAVHYGVERRFYPAPRPA